MSTTPPDDPEIAAIEQLERFGLSAYAARTFVALASLGTGTARDVSQVSEVPRTRVYDAVAHNAVVQEQILHREETPTYLSDESLIAHANGYVPLPEGPGLGVDIDEEALRDASGDTDWSPPDWRHEDGSLAE